MLCCASSQGSLILFGSINVADVRPRLFLSSTFADLYAERRVVGDIASALEWQAFHFETSQGLDPSQVLTRIHRDIRACDVFCILLASRYGSAVPELAISYTHFEFALARKLGKPMIALVLKEAELGPINREWDSPYPEGQFDLMNLRADTLIANSEGACIRQEYSSSAGNNDGLEQAAAEALKDARKRLQAGTFQQGSIATNSGIKKLIDAEQRTRAEASIFARRLTSVPAKAEASQYFFDYNLPLLVRNGRLNLFFGGGVTSSVLLSALLDALEWTKLYGLPRIRIFTTSVMLASELSTKLYGLNCELLNAPGELDEKYMAVRLDETLREYLRHGFWQIPNGERGLFVSGVSLPLDPSPGGLASTGTYRLFKSASAPTEGAGVLFLNLASHPHYESYEEILPRFLTRESSHREIPLSLCIAAGAKDRRSRISALLAESAFEPIVPSYDESEYQSCFPVLARNRAFEERFIPLIG